MKIIILSVAIFGILAVSAVPFYKHKGSKRLIKTSESKPAEWLSEAEIQSLIAKDQGFIDVTHVKEYDGKQAQNNNKGILE